MARGFESKSVESQQEEAARRRARRREPDPMPVDPVRADRRRTLELARLRTEADLRTATHPAHRAMLTRALAALGEQIKALEEKA